MKLFILNSKPADPNGYIFQALVRALHRRADVELHVIRRENIQAVPIDPKNQALLVYGGEELHQFPKEYILKPFGRRAIWFTEDPYEAKRNKKSAELFHIVFSNDTGSISEYQDGRHLSLATDPNLLQDDITCTPKNLLFFSGTAWPNRKKLVSTLLERWRHPNELDLHLVGNKFVEEQTNYKELSLKLELETAIPISEFILRAANSICTLVVGRDFSGSGKNNFARSPGPRLFEAGMTGSCQLVHASEIPDMPKELKEGLHYQRFESAEHLIKLLREAKTEPEKFRAMGDAMAAEIKNKHNYDRRAEVIIEALHNCDPEEVVYKAPVGKQRALFISHEQTKPGFQHGGAGLCLDKILEASPNNVDVRVLCREGDGHNYTILNRYGTKIGGFRCKRKVDEFSLHHQELEENIRNLLEEWQPNLVHLNHLLGITPDILALARMAGAHTSITLHDYYVICDSWNLLNEYNEFCGIKDFYDVRCQSCCANRRPNFRSVDPTRRRVAMAEAIAHAQVVITPSKAAEEQLREVMPHLPQTKIIEPIVARSNMELTCGTSDKLIVLVPGNLAINKGYFELRRIVEHSSNLGLSIQFRILGRVEAWIEQELSSFKNVQLLGSYNQQNFASKATGVDLGLFLSTWPETYCITFDEWKLSGRPCFYYTVGALGESHRRKGLHQASEGFSVDDRDSMMSALIQASSPTGLDRLREPNENIGELTEVNCFGSQHWSIFEKLLENPPDKSSINWAKHGNVEWVEEHETMPLLTTRQRVKNAIYKLPNGSKLAAIWRRIRGR